jgi:hypothetical protein
VLAYRYQGTRYDCGSKLGYLEATVAFGLRHPEVGKDFAAMLKRCNEPAGSAQKILDEADLLCSAEESALAVRRVAARSPRAWPPPIRWCWR